MFSVLMSFYRFIGKGTGFSTEANGGVVPGSAKVFDYQAAYGLTSEQVLYQSSHAEWIFPPL